MDIEDHEVFSLQKKTIIPQLLQGTGTGVSVWVRVSPGLIDLSTLVASFEGLSLACSLVGAARTQVSWPCVQNTGGYFFKFLLGSKSFILHLCISALLRLFHSSNVIPSVKCKHFYSKSFGLNCLWKCVFSIHHTYYILECRISEDHYVLLWCTFCFTLMHIWMPVPLVLVFYTLFNSVYSFICFSLLLMQVELLHCTLYSADMQDYVFYFYPINKHQMRNCLLTAQKEQLTRGRVLWWKCFLWSIRDSVIGF